MITLLAKQNTIKTDTNQEHSVRRCRLKTLRNGPRDALRRTLSEEVLLETINLMHPLVQDRDNSDIPVRKVPPIHEMPLVPEEIPFHPEFGGHGPRLHTARFDLLERGDKLVM